mmetsp:Transcript_25927/g.42118  ORF Transcript_25927/g.42118 Transcript_25927/m.42118 type:complete len:221 (+) Transcript_25927:281-943(+)
MRSMPRLLPTIIPQKFRPPTWLGPLPHVQPIRGCGNQEEGNNNSRRYDARLLRINVAFILLVRLARGIYHRRTSQPTTHAHRVHRPVHVHALILQPHLRIKNGDHLKVFPPARVPILLDRAPPRILQMTAHARLCRPHRGPRCIVPVDRGILPPSETGAEFRKGANASDADATALVLGGVEGHGVESLGSAVVVRFAVLLHDRFQREGGPGFFVRVKYLV